MRMMARLAGSRFPHRRNADGSYDSICIVCLATVASTLKEERLYFLESAHVCDPMRLYQVSQGQNPLVARPGFGRFFSSH
jgi:hypothetical protein